jgi:hypothetical protein
MRKQPSGIRQIVFKFTKQVTIEVSHWTVIDIH